MRPIESGKPGHLKRKSRAGARLASRKRAAWGYLIVWEFQVRAGIEERFEKVCGSDGDWARFFSQDKAYMGTELIRDLKGERIYVTLDFWTSQESYESFRKRHHTKYKALDRKYEEMTESEREIGRFARVSSR